MTNECVWDKQVNANDLWEEMIKKVLKIAKEILGESKSYIRCKKETWWWNSFLIHDQGIPSLDK